VPERDYLDMYQRKWATLNHIDQRCAHERKRGREIERQSERGRGRERERERERESESGRAVALCRSVLPTEMKLATLGPRV
jgi:hypothetical protein